MKILHIITRLVRGGAQQNTILCCAAQVAAGHQVFIAYGPDAGPEGSLVEEAKASGAELIEVKTLVRSVRLGVDRRCRRDLEAVIARVQPDVVHTHSSKAGIVGRAAAWRCKTPVVVHTIHGLPFHVRQAATLNLIYTLVEHWAARRCHKLIGITQAMCTSFRRRLIAPKSKFVVIPSGVEIDKFTLSPQQRTQLSAQVRQELGIAADAPVVGIVARLDPLKGHDDLLNVLPRLKRKHPGLQALIVGDGAYAQRIAQRLDFSTLGEYVHMTGLAAPDEVIRYLAAMDVMVLPSYQEGQSRTLVEALLAGCGIVAYNVGGIGEVCLDQQTGLLVKKGRWGKLYQALHRMLSDTQLRQTLVAQGQAHVREHFSAALMCQRLDELYRQLLAPTPETKHVS